MAVIYFNNGNTSNGDWNDSNNWWTEPERAGGNTFPAVDDTLFFETTCTDNIPLQLDYFIIIQTGASMTIGNADTIQTSIYTMFVEAGGELNISSSTTFGGTCTVHGVINIAAAFQADVFSLVEESQCNINGATVNIYPNAITSTINVINGSTLNIYNYTVASPINVSNSTVTYNNIVIDNAPTITGNSTIALNGQTEIVPSITIPVNAALQINNATITFGCVITNNGTSSIVNVNGSGTFINNNSCSVTGTVSELTFTNNNVLAINSGGTFGPIVFNNNGTTNVNSNASISIKPTSVFTNNGTFNFGSLYSTSFKGRIFPQVPSSASWGNALL